MDFKGFITKCRFGQSFLALATRRRRGGFTYLQGHCLVSHEIIAARKRGLVLTLTFFAVLLNALVLLTFTVGRSPQFASASDYSIDWHAFRPFDGKLAFLSLASAKYRQELNHEVTFVSQIISDHRRPSHEIEDLAHSIVAESRQANYDPLFVAAVIRSESTFNRFARSPVGAVGLMQLMPATARYIAERADIDFHKLQDPRQNIRLGIAYLKYLEQKFRGNRKHVLIAYNWGPYKLQNSLKEKSAVPGSTLRYAQTILSTHRRWRTDYNVRLSQADANLYHS